MALDNDVEIETPERIRFRYRAAGPVRRALAYLVDLLLRGAIAVVLSLLVLAGSSLRAEQLSAASGGVLLMALFVLEWGYYVAFDLLWNGSSPGRSALRLRVVKEGGFPLGPVDSVLRNLLRAADFLPFGYVLGLAVMSGDRRFRRLGDRVAGTMVVVEEKASVGAPVVLAPPATAQELDGLPARPPLEPGELEAIEMFLRRPDLAPARRQELAEILASGLARRMGRPAGDPARFLALVHARATGARTAGGAAAR
jgi:uncharacterized RDD family membrane protein YckC